MRHREQEATHRRRLAAIEQEWEWFKAGMQQAQRAQQQQAAMSARQQLIDALHAHNSPPQAPEPEVIVIEHGGVNNLMFNDLLHRRW
jgi:broad specificity phosphatase PhoE